MLWILCKAMGACCVVGVGAICGFRKADQIMRRVKILEEMSLVLYYIDNNLQFQCDRTYDVLCNALNHTEKQVLFLPVGMLKDGPQMEYTLHRMVQRMYQVHMQEVPLEELQWFGTALTTLGTCPAGEAQQKIKYAIAQIETTLVLARENAKQQQKLYRTVGVSLGCVAALLLL